MKKLISSIKNTFFKTYARTFVTLYFLFGLIGGLLLWLPISQRGENVGFLNSLFISISAMSTTGLSPINLRDSFNIFGYIVIMFIMEIGGLGIYMLFANFLILTGAKIGLTERAKLASEQNLFTVKGIVRRMRNIFITIILIQIVFGIYFWLDFYYSKVLGDISLSEALLQGSFFSISTFMNAGFTIFINPNTTATMFYANHYGPLIIAMIAIFLGGVGYLPISEILEKISSIFKKKRFKLSYISKLLIFSHLGIWLVGMVLILLFERNHLFSNFNDGQMVMASAFTSISTRSAGFSVMNSAHIAQRSTKILMSLLMIIGASPNSAGGGLRTTTLVLLLANIKAFAKKSEQIMVDSKHAIKKLSVEKALSAVSILIVLLFTFTTIISIYQPELRVFDIFFELSSAFGTVGYSVGVTEASSVATRIILVFFMFLGRISLVSFMAIFGNTKKKTTFKYTELDLMVN